MVCPSRPIRASASMTRVGKERALGVVIITSEPRRGMRPLSSFMKVPGAGSHSSTSSRRISSNHEMLPGSKGADVGVNTASVTWHSFAFRSRARLREAPPSFSTYRPGAHASSTNVYGSRRARFSLRNRFAPVDLRESQVCLTQGSPNSNGVWSSRTECMPPLAARTAPMLNRQRLRNRRLMPRCRRSVPRLPSPAQLCRRYDSIHPENRGFGGTIDAGKDLLLYVQTAPYRRCAARLAIRHPNDSTHMSMQKDPSPHSQFVLEQVACRESVRDTRLTSDSRRN